jgi:hypothetical protein
MTSSRRFVAAAASGLAAVLAAPAIAAYICHPDPAGTRTLAITGSIERYTLDGPHVSVAVRSGHRCDVVAWNILTGLHRTAGTTCRSLFRRSLSAPGGLRTFVHAPTATRPGTLDVFRGAQRISSWPLPARPRLLHVAAGYALFAGADGGAYAMRLRDGHVALLGPEAAGDDPQINELGAVFAARFAYSNTTGISLKFVPRSGLDAEIAKDARPLRTGGAIRSVSMDGPRVALAVRDRAGRCDRVMYWNVLRAPVQRISGPDGPTCVPGRPTGISAVAIGGLRTEWLAQSGNRAALVVGSVLCQEWVVRRLLAGHAGESVVGMAADGRTLAFAITEQQRELRGLASVAVVAGTYSVRTILSGRLQPVALAVDGHLVATALADGTADVRTSFGRSVADLRVGTVRAIALSGGKLVALRSSSLDVYDVASGKRIHTVKLPHVTIDALDVQYGIAVVASGRSALAVDLTTGSKALVGRAAGPLVGAMIERPGVAFASTSGDRGVATFVPVAKVEALLGRA